MLSKENKASIAHISLNTQTKALITLQNSLKLALYKVSFSMALLLAVLWQSLAVFN